MHHIKIMANSDKMIIISKSILNILDVKEINSMKHNFKWINTSQHNVHYEKLILTFAINL